MSWVRHQRATKKKTPGNNTHVFGDGPDPYLVATPSPHHHSGTDSAASESSEEEDNKKNAVEEEEISKPSTHKKRKAGDGTGDPKRSPSSPAVTPSSSTTTPSPATSTTPPPPLSSIVARPSKVIFDGMPDELRVVDGDSLSWKFEYISELQYVCRARNPKPRYNDSSVVCCCVRIDGERGCGPSCLNRLSCTECIPQFCPCAHTCSNQKFQRKEYAAVVPFKTARKGWGLMTLEDLPPNRFVIEYVGEVISMEMCQERMEADRKSPNPTRHMYYLSLQSDEVIDACKKGNLSRFINHSCSPNCMTVKWSVLGESRIGIFTLKHVPPGTELTFDYQFVRFGSEKQRCHCGSGERCRMFLGEPPQVDK